MTLSNSLIIKNLSTQIRDILNQKLSGKKVIILGAGIPFVIKEFRDFLRSCDIVDDLSLAASSFVELYGKKDIDDKTIIVPSPLYNHFALNINHFYGKLKILPEHAEKALVEFDPDHQAYVFDTGYSPYKEIFSRKIFGPRLDISYQIEDKHFDYLLFQKAGIPVPATKVCSITDDITWKNEFLRFDEGLGVVIVGNEEGVVRGGGKGIHVFKKYEDLQENIPMLKKEYQIIKFMPYLKGIPINVHGIVAPNGVMCFKPMETITLHSQKNHSFQYMGNSTHLKLSEKENRMIEEVFTKICLYLRDECGFLGFICFDGNISEKGFYLTDLNSRLGSGTNVISHANKDDPALFWFMDMLLKEKLLTELPLDEIKEYYNAAIEKDPQIKARLLLADNKLPTGKKIFDDPKGLKGEVEMRNHLKGTFMQFQLHNVKDDPHHFVGPRMAELYNKLPSDYLSEHGKMTSF